MEAAPPPSSKSSTQKPSPPPSTSGTCPFHNWFYIGVAILGITYAVYVGDKDGFKEKAISLHLGPVYTIFQLIDKYSPFNEILESDEDILKRLKKQHQQQ